MVRLMTEVTQRQYNQRYYRAKGRRPVATPGSPLCERGVGEWLRSSRIQRLYREGLDYDQVGVVDQESPLPR